MSLSNRAFDRRRQEPAIDLAPSRAATPSLDDYFLEERLADDHLLDGWVSDESVLDGHNGLDGVSTSDTERLALLERCAWTVVWLGVLVNACYLWGSWWSWPVVNALAPSLVAVALAGFAICWCTKSPRVWWHQGTAMAAALTSVVTQQVFDIHTRIYYSTDSAALDHVAARLLADGQNPYTSSLTSAARLLKPAIDYWTYTVTGGHVVNLSYPAGSALVYASAFALGFRHEVVDWMDLYLWTASAIMLFLLVPRSLRWISALVALIGFFVAFFSNGGTDAAFMPFAMIAVWRWDRYGRGKDSGIARWVGPVALGLACSIKQTPWFFIPFLLVGIYIETRRAGRSPFRVVGRYLAVVAGVFTAVNLPFIIWGASAWWHGTTTPIIRPLVADGQGLVSLALHGLTGGVDLRLLTAASGVALLCSLAAFAGWYHQLKRIWLLLLPVVFFISPRSLSSYLLDLFPVALVALISTETPRLPSEWRQLQSRGHWEHLRQWSGRTWARFAAITFAVVTCVTAALSFTGAPLDLTLRSASVGYHQTLLGSVTVTVTNRTSATVVPHFMVDVGAAHPAGFWATSDHRPVVIGPHGSRTVTLFPPSTTYLPPEASDYVVQAYTANPEALSTTNDIWRNYSPKRAPR